MNNIKKELVFISGLREIAQHVVQKEYKEKKSLYGKEKWKKNHSIATIYLNKSKDRFDFLKAKLNAIGQLRAKEFNER